MGFPSIYELMEDLRGMAESNAVSTAVPSVDWRLNRGLV